MCLQNKIIDSINDDCCIYYVLVIFHCIIFYNLFVLISIIHFIVIIGFNFKSKAFIPTASASYLKFQTINIISVKTCFDFFQLKQHILPLILKFH